MASNLDASRMSIVDSEAAFANAQTRFQKNRSASVGPGYADMMGDGAQFQKAVHQEAYATKAGGAGLVLDGESFRDDASVATTALDVDVEEVQDRLDLLKETVDELCKDQQNLEIFKIVSRSFCKFLTVLIL